MTRNRRPLSEETKAKIAASRKGKKRPPFSAEWKENLRQAALRAGNKPPSALGRIASPETRAKLSARNKGNKYWLGRKHSLETRKKMGLKGDRHPLWRGGISSEHVRIRNSAEYREWRKSVFERDQYTCVICGARTKKGLGKRVVLNADHIKSFSRYPELRFDITNGRTLCFDCHKTTDSYGGKNSRCG